MDGMDWLNDALDTFYCLAIVSPGLAALLAMLGAVILLVIMGGAYRQ